MDCELVAGTLFGSANPYCQERTIRTIEQIAPAQAIGIHGVPGRLFLHSMPLGLSSSGRHWHLSGVVWNGLVLWIGLVE